MDPEVQRDRITEDALQQDFAEVKLIDQDQGQEYYPRLEAIYEQTVLSLERILKAAQENFETDIMIRNQNGDQPENL